MIKSWLKIGFLKQKPTNKFVFFPNDILRTENRIVLSLFSYFFKTIYIGSCRKMNCLKYWEKYYSIRSLRIIYENSGSVNSNSVIFFCVSGILCAAGVRIFSSDAFIWVFTSLSAIGMRRSASTISLTLSLLSIHF